jgi:hypothetical protein
MVPPCFPYPFILPFILQFLLFLSVLPPFSHAWKEVYLSESIVITCFLYSIILIEVYIDLIYLPRGPHRNDFSIAMYDFTLVTVNSVINLVGIPSSQKSTVRVNLLLTYCNCSIYTRVHSNCPIHFFAWLSFNLNIHSCNKCGKSQKKTSCKSVNTYFSRYLPSVTLGFLLSLCANTNSFVFVQLSIYSFVGFHYLNIPF